MVKCPYCGYEWRARVDRPKACPDCKRRLPREKDVPPPVSSEGGEDLGHDL